jgi:benzoylformate decarboxylase
MATVREVTYDLLRRLGIDAIFGNPGSTELPFLMDFPEDFRYVLALHEGSALGMAEGYAQGTGNAALVNLHTAPGLGNAMGAMVTAYLNKTPLIVTAGQQDRRHVALEPLLSGNLVDLARPYVKRSHEPARAEDVPREVLRAYHTAMQHPRGPVFISVPMDDWDAEAEPPAVREVHYRAAPDPDGLQRAVAVLEEAHSPAIVAGPGVARSGGFGGIVALAERLRAPVWQESIGALIGFPQNHPLYRGYLAHAQRKVAETLSPHDAVLVLGAPVFTYYPYVPGPTVEKGTRVVQVTDDPEEASRADAHEVLVCDVGRGIEGLLERISEPDRPMPPARERPPEPEESYPMSVDFVMRAIAEAMPEGTIVVDESTSSKGVLRKRILVDEPDGYHTSAAGGLGFCLPASVGLKLALPDRPVACVIGDGSTMYSIQALWSAAQEGAPVAVLVINNGGYSILKAFQDVIGIKDVPGLDLPGIDVVKVAHGLGCDGETVEKPDGLRAALRRAFAATDRPYVVNAVVSGEVPKLLG